ncbi:hypothetical protein CDL15_Pgr011905 [Punica granatum]|uniref:Uncharacterized protein n=1 Tax=Punica granatum TaxID=22663 RepID=A0A218WD65_PUNGR|nr:hypothetical protein CDL15_Pgr011905 [Punica granatum]
MGSPVITKGVDDSNRLGDGQDRCPLVELGEPQFGNSPDSGAWDLNLGHHPPVWVRRHPLWSSATPIGGDGRQRGPHY